MKISEIRKGLLLLSGAISLFSCTQDPESQDEGIGEPGTADGPEKIVLTEFEPAEAKAGATVILSGENFGTSKTGVSVWFGDIKLSENMIITVKDDAIIVYVPEIGAEAESVEIKVQVGKAEAKTYEALFGYLVDEPVYETIWEVETFAGSGEEAPGNAAPKDGSASEATFRRITDIIYDPVDNAMFTIENTDVPKGLRRIKDGMVETLIYDLGFNPKSLAFSLDGSTLYIGTDSGSENAVVYLLRSEGFKTVHPYVAYSSGITQRLQYAAVNPVSGTMVMFCQENSKLFVWDALSGRAAEVGSFKDFIASSEGSIRFSPDGKTLYIVPNSYNGILKADWNLADSTLGEIMKFTGGNNGSGSTDGGPDEARFNQPFSICFDADENGIWKYMYVADRQNHLIRRVTPDGEVDTYAGNTQGFRNGALTESQFCRPCAVTFGEGGFLYIGEYRDGTANQGNRIRVIRSKKVQID